MLVEQPLELSRHLLPAERFTKRSVDTAKTVERLIIAVSKQAREAIAGRALQRSTRQCLCRQHVAFRGTARGRPLLVRGIRTTRFREST
jgi:hypothetical protein